VAAVDGVGDRRRPDGRLLLLAVLLAAELSAGASAGMRTAAISLSAAHAGAIVVRRLSPRGVAGWLLATAVAYTILGFPPGPPGPLG
jgi:hypothetical protein